MNRRIIGLALGWGIGILSWAQITIEGVVTDTTGRPLPAANVLVMDAARIIAFGATDARGRFSVTFRKTPEPVFLQVSYLGYQPYVDTISAESAAAGHVFRRIRLWPLPILLKEARVEYEIPLQVQGDTVIYTVDSFLTGTERNLRDILKRLPGLEVTPRGEVYFLGRPVTKVLVEGEKFFGGNVQTATENIPADVVDQIEVLSNYTDVALMKNVVQQGELVINVKLKKDKTAFWFGDLTAGGGVPRKYMGAASLYRYHPAWNFNLLGTAHNLSPVHSYGVISFDTRERYTLYVSDVASEGGLRFDGERTSWFSPFGWLGNLSGQRQAGGGLSTNFHTGDHLKWAVVGAGAHTFTTSRDEQQVRYLLPDSTRDERQSRTHDRIQTPRMAAVGTEWKPNPRTQVNLQGNYILQSEDRIQQLTSIPEGGPTRTLSSRWNHRLLRPEVFADVFRKLGKKHLVAAYLRYRVPSSIRGEWFRPAAFSPDVWAYFPPEVRDTDQYHILTLHRRHAAVMVDYYYLVHDQLHVNVRGGLIRRHTQRGLFIGRLDSSVGQVPEEPRLLPIISSETWQLNRRAAFASVGIQRIAGAATYRGAVRLLVRRHGLDSAGIPHLSFPSSLHLLPHLSVEWELAGRRKVETGYTERVIEPAADQVVPIAYFASPQIVTEGTPTLRPARERRFHLHYRRFIAHRSFYVGLNLSQRRDAVRYHTHFVGVDRFQRPQNLPTATYQAELNGHTYRSTGAFSAFLTWNITHHWDYRIVEGNVLPNPYFSAYWNFNIGYEPTPSWTVELDGRGTATLYRGQPLLWSFSGGPQLQWEVLPFLRAAIRYHAQPVRHLAGGWRLNHNLTADLRYEPDEHPWTVSLRGWNLLGRHIEETFSITETRITHQRTYLIAPYVVGVVQYKIR